MKILSYNRQTRNTDLQTGVPVDSRGHMFGKQSNYGTINTAIMKSL